MMKDQINVAATACHLLAAVHGCYLMEILSNVSW
jgi:hypothetical protein